MKLKVLNLTILVITFLFTIPSHSQKEISRDWTSFVQTIEVSTDKNIKFKVVASAKTEREDDWSWSGIWAKVDNKNNESGFFDNMGDRPIITNSWKSYSIEGLLDLNSKRISFGGLCVGNGKFYYDNFEVFTEKPDGTFEQLDIKNASFENKVTSQGIPDWAQGIVDSKPVNVKEFSYSATDDKVDGAYGLVIQGMGIEKDTSDYIGAVDGYSTQVGTLVSMLNNLSKRVESTVGFLNQQELDYLLDKNANSIGALIMHLVATEVYYQNFTFGNMDYIADDVQKWASAMVLGEEGRKTLKGHDAVYYFDIWKKVRARTLEELQKKDDLWLAETNRGSGMTNHYAWFHVMEHQSSHLGQMLLLRKRIPDFPVEPKLVEKIKD
jgi:uncharacterized damage-inducible protein DinB